MFGVEGTAYLCGQRVGLHAEGAKYFGADPKMCSHGSNVFGSNIGVHKSGQAASFLLSFFLCAEYFIELCAPIPVAGARLAWFLMWRGF